MARKLNMIPDSQAPCVLVSQYDVGRELAFNLTNGSEPYTVPAGATVKIQATKPSGLGFNETCTASGSTVTIDTTEGMTDEYGSILTEIVVLSGTERLGSANFILMVEPSPHPTGTTDGMAEEVIPELTVLVERIETAAESIHDLTVSASSTAPSVPASATYDGTTNHISFGIPVGISINCTDANSDGNVVITITTLGGA